MISVNLILKNNTADLHKRLEQIGFVDKIMDKTLSLEEYKKLIAANFIFHQPLERHLSTITGLSELNIKWKMPFLEQDRLAVGGFDHVEVDNPFLPQDLYEALGCMYVLEGATLGGRVIKRHLQMLPLEMHYYGCYGEESGMYWKTFMQNLETYIDTDSKADIALKAPQETFAFGIRCFEKVIGKEK
jgi:heme oxygenase